MGISSGVGKCHSNSTGQVLTFLTAHWDCKAPIEVQAVGGGNLLGNPWFKTEAGAKQKDPGSGFWVSGLGFSGVQQKEVVNHSPMVKLKLAPNL